MSQAVNDVPVPAVLLVEDDDNDLPSSSSLSLPNKLSLWKFLKRFSLLFLDVIPLIIWYFKIQVTVKQLLSFATLKLCRMAYNNKQREMEYHNTKFTFTERLQCNDPELDHLELLDVDNIPDEFTNNNNNNNENNDNNNNNLLYDMYQAMKQNQSIKYVVIGSQFTEIVIGPAWEQFVTLGLCQLQNLEQIEFIETCIPYQSVIQLLRHIPKLRAISIEDGINGIITRKDMLQLADALRGHSCLEEFIFVHNFYGIVTKSSTTTSTTMKTSQHHLLLDPLIEAVSTIPNLKMLKISNTSPIPPNNNNNSQSNNNNNNNNWLVSEKSLACLGQVSTLQALDLSSLGLTDTHFQTLAQHVLVGSPPNNNNNNNRSTTNQTNQLQLETVYLLHNPASCSTKGVTALTVALEHNYILQHVFVVDEQEEKTTNYHHHHHDRPEIIQKLNLLLHLNRLGCRRTIFNHECPTRQRDWFYVLSRFNDNPDALYYMLRENPDLWIF